MSTSTRAVSSPTAAPVSSGTRAGGVARMAAANFTAPVSDIEAQANIAGGMSPFSFRDYARYVPPENYRPPSDRPRMNFGSSRDFASAFEAHLEDGVLAEDEEGEGAIAEMSTRMARAVHIYERNAATMLNAPKTRGVNLSMTL